MAMPAELTSVSSRARQSLGLSSPAIHRMVDAALDGRHPGGGTLVDVGCGAGSLWKHVRHRFDRCIGVDVVRFDGYPDDAEFIEANLDAGIPLPDGLADVAAAVETIEHLENPRALMRELTRLVRPGGWVIVTTPNQLSLLSKLTLLLKNQFNAFQESSYPAHITALLEIDLRRMAAECGLGDVAIRHSQEGRIPGTRRHWPGMLSRWCPRALSDNVLLAGRRPDA